MNPPLLPRLAIISTLLITGAAAAPQGFAVVELFTSQGCSSCPPADRVLADLTDRAVRSKEAIVCLSFHVDYWNRLGWVDPFSRAEFSERQRAYGQRWGSTRIYTPQMVVNGTVEFVGSDRRLAQSAVSRALVQKPGEATLSLRLAPGEQGPALRVSWETGSAPVGAVVNLALVERATANDVPAGENHGRELQHRNVVRDFRSLPSATATGETTLTLPAGSPRDAFLVIGYLQAAGQGAIMASAQLAL